MKITRQQFLRVLPATVPVSYTHLDVYKRQTSEGVAGTVRPSRLSGVTLSDLDVRYYTVNDAGQIDRLILNLSLIHI